MSVLTTTSLKSAPTAAGGVAINDNGGSRWAASSWVEVLASAPGSIAIAGMSLEGISGSFSNSELEFEFGVGAAGSESLIGTMRVYASNSGNPSGPEVAMFPVPLGGVGTGDRVAMRVRQGAPDGGSGNDTFTVSMLYYDGLDSDVVTGTEQLTSAPLSSDGALVSLNGTAWADTSWVELTSGLATSAGIAGLSIPALDISIDWEIDIGIGASGSEVVLTTLRGSFRDNAIYYSFQWLAALHYVPASTRIALRVRKSGTSTPSLRFALIYYADVAAPGGGGGTSSARAWARFTRWH